MGILLRWNVNRLQAQNHHHGFPFGNLTQDRLYNLRLTADESRETVVANGVIPVDWKPGQTYRSRVNFKA